MLTRVLGDIDAAEDAVADAFAVALERWPRDGAPPSPAGWIITTARHKAIDHIRREQARAGKQEESLALTVPADPIEEGAVADDQLRLIFTCCHPALSRPAQVALTLRLLGGLTTPEIARAFLVPEPTIGQRISRAKAKIRDAHIPYRVPHDADLPARVAAVLAVVYLIFNEGYAATSGPELARDDLTPEAVRLARLLATLLPDEPEATGLLALLLLSDARRGARTDADGRLVPLPEQDRSRWDDLLIAEGHRLVRACLHRNDPGPFQLQAAINAVHTDSGPTDWAQIVALYDQLHAFDPSPVVALNRAVAVAELDGPAAALALVDGLDLPDYHLFHAVRADLLARIGRRADAAEAYERAAGLTDNQRERDHLLARRRALAG